MPLDWTPFVELVRRHSRFLLMTHVRPDGDGLGSQLALADALRRLGKTARVAVASNFPDRYRFLTPNGAVERFRAPGDEFRDAEVVVVMDTGTWNQLGDFGAFLRTLDVPKAVVDHHRTQDDLGGQRFVDITAEATGRLAYEAICALEVPLTESMARNLFVALAMDTGWFRHDNATAPSFALAERFVAAGAKPTPLFEDLFERSSLARLKLRGRALDRLETQAGGRIAFSWIRFPDYAETGAVPLDTEDLINDPRSIAGVEVALLFIEQRDGSVKVSFRSKRADVARLAEQFGGGGHRLASGATVPGPLTDARERVLAAVTAAVEVLR
jgi:bifunctional oligoribonuclease and PAP phosphatase NrnA